MAGPFAHPDFQRWLAEARVEIAQRQPQPAVGPVLYRAQVLPLGALEELMAADGRVRGAQNVNGRPPRRLTIRPASFVYPAIAEGYRVRNWEGGLLAPATPERED